MDIPADIFFPATLKPGSVFYFVEGSFLSTEPHYFVILNNDPSSTIIIVMVNASSQIAKRKMAARRNHSQPDTLVILGPQDCDFLTEDSVFDCNSPLILNFSDLLEKYKNGNFEHKGDVSPSILARLRRGLKLSKMVAQENKDLC